MLAVNWALDSIDAPEVWSQGYTGKGVVIAVIDSGIASHADLARNLWLNSDEQPSNRIDDDRNGYVDDRNGWDFIADSNSPLGANSHGTQMAGIIVAGDNGYGITGVAHGARIMPLRVFSEFGAGSSIDTAAAIRYAVDNGADIINLSIGGVATRSLELAIKYAASNDVLIVAASGNDRDSVPVYPAQYSKSLSNVISVGAFDSNFRRTAVSNRVGSSGSVQVDAPGHLIYSTTVDNQYSYLSGTSPAAAHVAGVAALVWSAMPSLSAAEVRGVIAASTSGRVADSDSLGAVNAKLAIDLVHAKTEHLPADLNSDGRVGFFDFLILAKNFGTRTSDRASGDIDGDGKIRFQDFKVLANSWGAETETSRRTRDAAVLAAAPPQSTTLADANTKESDSSAISPKIDAPLVPALVDAVLADTSANTVDVAKQPTPTQVANPPEPTTEAPKAETPASTPAPNPIGSHAGLANSDEDTDQTDKASSVNESLNPANWLLFGLFSSHSK